MKKRILFVVLFAVIIGCVSWAVLRPKEPIYNGKPLTYWIYQPGKFYFAHSKLYFPEVDSNALPYLTKALHWRGGIVGKNYYRNTWLRLPVWIQNRMPEPVDAEIVRWFTAQALGRLGTLAQPARPDLLRALREDDSMKVRAEAAESLGMVGGADEVVIAALIQALDSDNHLVRCGATVGLSNIDPPAKNATSALIKCLGDKDDEVRWLATKAIERIAPEALAKAAQK